MWNRRSPSLPNSGAVPPMPTDRAHLERELAEVKADDETLPITRTVLTGNEATEINRFARENHTDLIVMGTHGRTGLGRLLMGSVAGSVLRQGVPGADHQEPNENGAAPADGARDGDRQLTQRRQTNLFNTLKRSYRRSQ